MYITKHIYIRGNYRQDIFFDKVDFINAWNRIFISAYATGVEILAIAILSNHLHICIRFWTDESWTNAGGPCMSKFMHYLRMSLSLYFNYRYDVHGSLGSRRYGAADVEDINDDKGEDLKDLIRYIIRNVTHHNITKNYRGWEFSTFRYVYGINDESKCFCSPDIPEYLLKAYTPIRFKLPKGWMMSQTGMLIPPTEVFPRKEIESLFTNINNYLRSCDIPTHREDGDPKENNERCLGSSSTSDQKPTDRQIIDFISQQSFVPIVSMNKDQCLLAMKTIRKAYPNIPLSQLSRIFHMPKSTIHYWINK